MRRTATIARLSLLVLVIVVACNGSPATTPVPSAASPSAVPPSPASSATPAPSEAASAPNAVVPDSPAAGIVVGVDGSAPVKGFTLRTNDGTTFQFVIGQLENADEFPAEQLAEHQASAAPILVFFRPVNGQLVVYRMEDAG